MARLLGRTTRIIHLLRQSLNSWPTPVPCLTQPFRSVYTSPPRGAGFFMAPIVRGAVALGARLARRWWVKLSPDKRQAFKDSLYKNRNYFYGGTFALTGCGLYFYWSHIEVTPITGRKRFVMFSHNDLVELIEQEKDELISTVSGGSQALPHTHPLYRKVLGIVSHILASNWSEDFEGFQWNLHVLDNPDVINAVCLPGGDLFVFTGLINACHNEDELAFILSHEMAHAVLGHGAEGMSNTGVVEFFTLFLLATVWAVVPSDLAAFFIHGWTRSTAHVIFDYPYSRRLESEADSVGLMLAAKACYNPTKAASIWKHLPTHEGVVEYLTTHPSNETRYENLSGQLAGAQSVWEQSNCEETRQEASQFSQTVSKTLKKVFRLGS